ncbi:FAD-dependent oxidoreductase [Nocardia brasiliensis]|uniref:FAD-dependent oxidoreductase n=1 Tax=Nocardia brasiliensis TaxID=37326 RepID=UPI002455ED77|nr:FAD-dependent oxidoreductase [Nocardia brasiliensis]
MSHLRKVHLSKQSELLFKKGFTFLGDSMDELHHVTSAETNATTVLIVGAGPTGLTMAVELARSGVSFRLIDSAPGPRPGSRGKGVQPRTLEIFEDLGIVERVIANGQMAMPMNATGPDGQVTHGGTTPEYLTDRPDIPYPASVITPQWRVEEALRIRLEELGGAVEFDTALVGYTQTEDGIAAEIVTDGISTTIDARWLVGADGGHSIVRKQSGVTFAGETREDVRMIVADLPVSGVSRDAWKTWAHPTGLLSLCPLPSTEVFQYVASLPPGAKPRLSLADLQATVDQRTGRTDIRLHEPEWISMWRANIRLADHYRTGNTFLAGDAAHIHSPAGGQGMNTGIQDAHNLAWKFAAVVNDGAPLALLDSYESERRPVAAHVLALSNARLAKIVQTNVISVDRDASTIQLDVGYRGSVLASDDRDDQARLRAGDRAPDATELATADGVHRLFDLIGQGRFTLLNFGPRLSPIFPGNPPRVLHLVAKPLATDEFADTAGTLATAYASTDQTLVLIRPDGYIGLISDAGDSQAVTKYLAEFT